MFTLNAIISGRCGGLNHPFIIHKNGGLCLHVAFTKQPVSQVNIVYFKVSCVEEDSTIARICLSNVWCANFNIYSKNMASVLYLLQNELGPHSLGCGISELMQ